MGRTPKNVVELLKGEIPGNISRNQFCIKTGINQNSIDKYMSGIAEPTQASLQKLADYFEVHVAWLQGHFENMSYEKAKEYKTIQDSGKKSGWVGDILAEEEERNTAKLLMDSIRKEMPNATNKEINDFIKTAKITVQGNKIHLDPPTGKKSCKPK